MVPFAGYEMPLHYGSIINEHMAVREKCGIFDVSHMGRIRVYGPHAQDFLEKLLPASISSSPDGKAIYSFFLSREGTFIDDLIVYKENSHSFLLVVNAARHQVDIKWMVQNMGSFDVEIRDITEESGMIAIQGPQSHNIISSITGATISELKYYWFMNTNYNGKSIIIARTGYTGSRGYEIIAPPDMIIQLWRKSVEVGCVPCGLGARDSLRLEAGFPLYGNELSETITPLDTGMEKFMNWDKEFTGKDALMKKKTEGDRLYLWGFVSLHENAIPRKGMKIANSDGEEIGFISSGGFSPLLNRGIALGFINKNYNEGDEVIIMGGTRKIIASVKKPPFIQISR